LAHASGEWISSDWPVCPITDIATPHRMGAALSYARRYALFALVGIAGEDDLDGPDIITTEPSSATNAPNDTNRSAQTSRSLPSGSIQRKAKPVLAAEGSATLRDHLIAEIAELKDGDELAFWAHRRLPAKNTLTTEDALAVEIAYEQLLSPSTLSDSSSPPNVSGQPLPDDSNLQAKISAPQNAAAPGHQRSNGG
jgi:hypothetical protein